MKVVSLFDGISCGRLAFDKANVSVEEYVGYEIDENAIKISQQNYPEITREGSVVGANFNKYKGYDMVIGGSPCTTWSIAKTDGKRETTNEGVGWDLFCEFVRAIKEIQPKYFLYENNFSINKDIKTHISEALGVEYIMINSSLVSAQNRKRCYWTNIPNVTQPKDKGITLCDVVDFSKHEFVPCSKWVDSKWDANSKKTKRQTLKTVKSKKSSTLTTRKQHGGNYYCDELRENYCNLSVEDWEKLQTLPIGYVDKVGIANGHKYKSIGNGWTVDVIAHILGGINE